MSHSSSSSATSSYSSSSYGAPLGSYAGHTSYSSMDALPAQSPRIVPFTASVSNISNYRIDGMGANESLSETECPVSVYNPNGGKVLGCYSMVKPKPVVQPVVMPTPIVRRQVHYNTVRVVRPIVYVRYPVPTPVAVPMQRPVCGGGAISYSRYGNYWPRAGWGGNWGGASCGGW